MQLKSPRVYALDACGQKLLWSGGYWPTSEAHRDAEKAVTDAMHDFIMMLCQADYEGRAAITIIDDILRVLNRVEDPRQRELEF
jgi:hypothetical protein